MAATGNIYNDQFSPETYGWLTSGARSGQTLSPTAIRNIISSQLHAANQRRLSELALAEKGREFDVTHDLRERMFKEGEYKDVGMGAAQGAFTYGLGKHLGWWGKPKAPSPGATEVTGTGTPGYVPAGPQGESEAVNLATANTLLPAKAGATGMAGPVPYVTGGGAFPAGATTSEVGAGQGALAPLLPAATMEAPVVPASLGLGVSEMVPAAPAVLGATGLAGAGEAIPAATTAAETAEIPSIFATVGDLLPSLAAFGW